MEDNDHYTLEQMARMLGISIKRLRNRIYESKEHPPFFRPSAGTYLFPKKDFLRWRDSRLVKASA
jgi:AraC-like DNA-binding protein